MADLDDSIAKMLAARQKVADAAKQASADVAAQRASDAAKLTAESSLSTGNAQ